MYFVPSILSTAGLALVTDSGLVFRYQSHGLASHDRGSERLSVKNVMTCYTVKNMSV